MGAGQAQAANQREKKERNTAVTSYWQAAGSPVALLHA